MDVLAAVAIGFVVLGIVIEIVEFKRLKADRAWRGKRKL